MNGIELTHTNIQKVIQDGGPDQIRFKEPQIIRIVGTEVGGIKRALQNQDKEQI